METLNNYILDIYEKKNIRTYQIVEGLLEKFNYIIKSDHFENDIRKITLKHKSYDNIIIKSTIIFDDNGIKKEYIEIQYKKYLLKFSVYF